MLCNKLGSWIQLAFVVVAFASNLYGPPNKKRKIEGAVVPLKAQKRFELLRVKSLSERDPVALPLNCELLFNNQDHVSSEIFKMIPIQANWHEIVASPRCREAVSKKCHFWSSLQIAQVFKTWTDHDGAEVGSPSSRLETLLEMSCAQNFIFWSLIDFSQAPIIAQATPLCQIKHWLNLPPLLLLELFRIEQQQKVSGPAQYFCLPFPTLDVISGIKKILFQGQTPSSELDLWPIFNSVVLKFISKSQPSLHPAVSKYLVSVQKILNSCENSDEEQTLLKQTLWALRTEVFFLELLSKNSSSQRNTIWKHIIELLKAREKLAAWVSNLILHQLLSTLSTHTCSKIKDVFMGLDAQIVPNQFEIRLLEKACQSPPALSLPRILDALSTTTLPPSLITRNSAHAKETLRKIVLVELVIAKVDPLVHNERDSGYFTLCLMIFEKTSRDLEYSFEINTAHINSIYWALESCFTISFHEDAPACKLELAKIFNGNKAQKELLLQKLSLEESTIKYAFLMATSKDEFRKVGLRKFSNKNPVPYLYLVRPTPDQTFDAVTGHKLQPPPSVAFETFEAQLLVENDTSPRHKNYMMWYAQTIKNENISDKDFRLKLTIAAFECDQVLPVVISDQMKTKRNEGIDGGGMLNGWISESLEALSDPKHQLMTSCSTGHPLSKKFRWFVEKRVGFFAGIMVGKALQQQVSLPWILDPGFIDLIANPSEEKLKEYYFNAYQLEKEDIWKTFFANGNADFFYDHILPDLALSKAANLRLGSFFQKTNIFTADESEAMSSLEIMKIITGIDQNNISRKKFIKHANIQRLSSILLDWGLKAFCEFFEQFLSGLSKIFHAKSMNLPSSIAVFKSLLDPSVEAIGDTIVRALNFESQQNPLVPSLFENFSLPQQDVVISFIRALDIAQMKKFLAVWTGSPNVELGPSALDVEFAAPHVQAASVDVTFASQLSSIGTNFKLEKESDLSFLRQENDAELAFKKADSEEHLIDCEAYFRILDLAGNFQREMLLKKGFIVPETAPVLFYVGKAALPRVQTCFNTITIFESSAVKTITALAALLNYPPDVYIETPEQTLQLDSFSSE